MKKYLLILLLLISSFAFARGAFAGEVWLTTDGNNTYWPCIGHEPLGDLDSPFTGAITVDNDQFPNQHECYPDHIGFRVNGFPTSTYHANAVEGYHFLYFKTVVNNYETEYPNDSIFYQNDGIHAFYEENAPTPMYKCSGGSCVEDDENGTYSEDTCNNECAIPPALTGSPFNFQGNGNSVVPIASSSELLANVGTLFTDEWPLIAVFIGVPLAFYIIQRSIMLTGAKSRGEK